MSRVGLFGQISEINGHLYLSGAGVLQPDKLRQKKITCIINATTEEPDMYLAGIDYLKIRIDDHPEAHIDSYFDLVADRIKSTKEGGGKTLVHCVAGVSRSASLCIIYLIKHEHMNLRKAYFYVKSARPIIRPNLGFWKQMIDFEKRHTGVNSVSLIPASRGDTMIPDLYSEDLRRQIHNHFALQQPSSHRYPKSIVSSGLSNGSSLTNGLKKSSNNYLSSTSNGMSSSFNYGNSYRPLVAYRRSTSPAYSSSSSGGSYSSSSTGRGSSTYALPSHRYTNSSLFTPPSSRTKKHRNKSNSAAANGSIFSSLYQTSQDILFPTF